MRALPVGEVTFVFTDIEGSTKLFQGFGDDYHELLDAHHAIIREAVRAFRGSEVNAEGDGFFLAFSDPADAVQACVQAQRALSAQPWPKGAEVRVRMGLHTGAASPVNDDYVALAVHQAARIAATAHGGQIVVGEDTIRLLDAAKTAGARFRTLGRYRLKDFDEPVEIFQLEHADLPSDFPALRALPAAAHNLPIQRTPFVGRGSELAAVIDLLSRVPMVTIVGPGGAGKTRLSSEVAARVAETYRDGVWAVRLSSIDDPSLVPSVTASTLGIREQPDKPLLDTITEVLELKRLLLLFDNCEHVVDEAASLIETILDRCEEVHIMTTSRVPVGVRGEQTFRLSALSMPEERGNPTDALTSEAVQLFVDRARLADPSFELDETNVEPVRAICRNVDGIPLALELAAARLRVMSVRQLAARLGHALDILSAGNRADEPRQQTVRAMIAWSHQLLREEERVLFRRLSIFRSTFTLDAIEAVCADEKLARLGVFPALLALVDQSLVTVGDEGDEPRYRMLVLIRAFAEERLGEAHETDETASRHRKWFLDRLSHGLDEDERVRRVRDDLDNFRGAAALESGDPDHGLAVATRLAVPLRRFGLATEVRSMLLAKLAKANGSAFARADAWLEVAGIESSQERVEAVQAAVANAEELFPEMTESERLQLLGRLLFNQGRLYRMQGLYEESEQTLRASVEAEKAAGEFGAVALNELGIVFVVTGRSTEASVLFVEMLEFARGRPEATHWAPRALGNLAELVRRSGDISRALELELEAARYFVMLEDKEGLGFSILGLGTDLIRTGAPEDGVRVTAAGDELLKSTGTHLIAGDNEIIERVLIEAREKLGSDRFHRMWEEGRRMTPSTALDVVTNSIDRPPHGQPRCG